MKFLRSLFGPGDNGEAGEVPVDVSAPLPATSYYDKHVLTTTPLLGGAVYTSPAIDCGVSPSPKSVLVFLASADQNGSFVLQVSDDGLTWYTYASFGLSATGANSSTNLGCGRYVRFVFTNGATNQTKFRLAYALK